MKTVLVDSGFWFALLGTRYDKYRPNANAIFERIEKLQCTLIVPYPSLYETVNSKLLKDKNQKAADWFLQQLNTNSRYVKVADDNYRDAAFRVTNSNHKRGISLVDSILRVMMEDESLRIDTFVTFNTGDFVDVCQRVGIDLINEDTLF